MTDKELDRRRLKPCPFCGGSARISTIDDVGSRVYAAVNCMNMYCEASVFAASWEVQDAKKAALERWNRRAEQ